MIVQLATRIGEARRAVGLSQEAAATFLGLSRSAVSELEAGKRPLSGLELAPLARLLGLDGQDFFSDSFDAERSASAVLFGGNPDLCGDADMRTALNRTLSLGRMLRHLEEVLEVLSPETGIPSYAPPFPESKQQAVRQGEQCATFERRRLGLGAQPLPDLAELLDTMGVRATRIPMARGVSGLTLIDRSAGIVVGVNRSHDARQQRFSFAHEYAHVLFDRERQAGVSRIGDRDSLAEVRADAFAAAFLLPADGVRECLEYLAKGHRSGVDSIAFGGCPTPSVPEESGAEEELPLARPAVRIHDVAMLANRFGLDRRPVLRRLKRLGIVGDRQFVALCAHEEQFGEEAARILGLREQPVAENRRSLSETRLVALGVEALRREAISWRKLCELAEAVGLDEQALEHLVVGAGIDPRPPAYVLPVDWDALRSGR